MLFLTLFALKNQIFDDTNLYKTSIEITSKTNKKVNTVFTTNNHGVYIKMLVIEK